MILQIHKTLKILKLYKLRTHMFCFCSLSNTFWNLNNVFILTRSNYRTWKDLIENYISMHDYINYCITEEELIKPANNASKKDTEYYKKWFRSNKMAKHVIRFSMSKTIRGRVDKPELVFDQEQGQFLIT